MHSKLNPSVERPSLMNKNLVVHCFEIVFQICNRIHQLTFIASITVTNASSDLFFIPAHKIMKLQKRIYYLKKVSNEFVQHGENPVASQIEHLQRDLEMLTGTLPKKPITASTALATKPSAFVEGFEFPLTEKEEIERLESEVHNDPDIRYQYINFLISKKPTSLNLVQFLPMVFSDEALISYNFHGSHASGKSKVSMKGYSIFSNCFLEAFEGEGLDMDELSLQLTTAIKQSRNRMRQRTFRAKKTLKRISDKGSE
ncbi:uncharacterized protein LOC135697383 [Ochlerotatus camptorhynchus]|uniref:uncharacterized protein LOC135697383 n=1 Tax=Ochlerotatus camptorhynchus TaxID=644619 RepID=UPI0031DA4CE7